MEFDAKLYRKKLFGRWPSEGSRITMHARVHLEVIYRYTLYIIIHIHIDTVYIQLLRAKASAIHLFHLVPSGEQHRTREPGPGLQAAGDQDLYYTKQLTTSSTAPL